MKKFVLFLSFVCGAVYGRDLAVRDISDDSPLRRQIAENWFYKEPRTVLSYEPFITALPSGERVRVLARRERGRAEFSVILARERQGRFTGWEQGSFIVSRSTEDGSILRVRIFLRSDPYTYIQFRHLDKNKSYMDVVCYDAYLSRGFPIPYSISKVLETPLNDILNEEKALFPLRYFQPDPLDYVSMRLLLKDVRSQIKPLRFADDGAQDAAGRYVFISNGAAQEEDKKGLNCSGFAKWFVDGLISGISGNALDIDSLKVPYGQRGSLFTVPYERARDPYFGLDWVRNLAADAGTAFKSPSFASLDDIEVRQAPFSVLRDRSKNTIFYYPGHLQDAGFGMEGIQPLLYTLAIDEPGVFFLGAVSNVGGTPPLRTFFHIVILAPYFDEEAVFHIAIFESAEETSFNKFKTRYPGGYINLCRLPTQYTTALWQGER